MATIIAYSDLEFFQEIDKQITSNNVVENPEIYSSVFELRKFIENTTLTLQPLEDNTAYLSSIYFKILFKSGTISLDYNQEEITPYLEFTPQQTNHTRPIFLLSAKNERHKATLKSNGYLTICSECFADDLNSITLSGNVIKIEEIEISNTDLSAMGIQCNAIIIIDKYLFTSPHSWPKTIKYILEKILPPKTCKATAQITIVTDTKKDQDKRNDIEKIKQIIKSIRGENYPFTLNIFHTPKHGHKDRHILSNYHLISSGHGFDLSKSKETTILINYIGNRNQTGNSIMEAYDYLLDEVRKLVSPVLESQKTAKSNIRVAYGDWKEGNRLINH